MKRFNAARLIGIVGKGLTIPPGGWNAHTFALYGVPMLVTMSRVAKITQRQAARTVSAKAARFFEMQTRQVCRMVTGKGMKDIYLETPPGQEALWIEAIQRVINETGAQLSVEILPDIQSVMAQGVSKVSILMAQEPPGNAENAMVARRSRELAAQVTRVNDTTREKMRDIIVEKVSAGATVQETADSLTRRMRELDGPRALTIARTEMQTAWTDGAKQVYRGVNGITHVSVIGCESNHEGEKIPEQYSYHGQSTCNIIDVPIHDMDKLQWHPNHTGTLVPSRFVGEY